MPKASDIREKYAMNLWWLQECIYLEKQHCFEFLRILGIKHMFTSSINYWTWAPLHVRLHGPIKNTVHLQCMCNASNRAIGLHAILGPSINAAKTRLMIGSFTGSFTSNIMYMLTYASLPGRTWHWSSWPHLQTLLIESIVHWFQICEQNRMIISVGRVLTYTRILSTYSNWMYGLKLVSA